jgi:putative ABC transport system ATP-binding protein
VTAIDAETAHVAANEAVLDLVGVEKSFAGPHHAPRRVLSGVDLTVGRGEILAVAGRSGSGKTTLLTIVAGWERADAGSVRLLGGQVGPDRLGWADLAILPQALGLLDELSVAENIALPLRLAGGVGAADPDSLMTRLGIDQLADRFPDEVSLGEQQRAALARAAVARPRVLLADEPIAHQNRAWAEGMMLLLSELAAGGTTCLIATHNDVAFDVADRVVEMWDGRLRPLSRS